MKKYEFIQRLTTDSCPFWQNGNGSHSSILQLVDWTVFGSPAVGTNPQEVTDLLGSLGGVQDSPAPERNTESKETDLFIISHNLFELELNRTSISRSRTLLFFSFSLKKKSFKRQKCIYSVQCYPQIHSTAQIEYLMSSSEANRMTARA